MSQPLSAAAKRLLGAARSAPRFRDGGLVRGPGTPTSDSVDAKLSRDEFVLPADTVRAVGIKSLRDLVSATHRPTGRPRHRRRFADGGMVDEERQKPNSFGDAAAGASTPGTTVTQPLPAAASAPAASTGTAPAKDFSREELIAQIPKDDGPSITAGRRVGDSWTDTELGRNVYNSAMALPGVSGALPAVAQTGGLISKGINAASRLMDAGMSTAATSAALPSLASAASNAPAPRSVAVGAGAGRGQINPAFADPNQPHPTSTSPAAAPAPAKPSWDRAGMTNAEVGAMNPQGKVAVQRQANGTMSFSGGDVSGPVSYTNAKGDALPGGGLNGRGFGRVDVAPNGSRVSMDDNGNYAFATSGGGANGGSAASRLLNAGTQSPVGMSPEQAFQAGLISSPTPVDYNPAYDQRLNQAGVAPASNDGAAGGSGGDAQARLMAVGSGGVDAPVVAHSGNDWQARKDLQNAATAAGSIMNRPTWQGTGMGRFSNNGQATTPPAVAAYQAMLQTDQALKQAQPGMDQAGMRENAATGREGMQQAGATERAQIGARHYDDANAIARGELAIKQGAAAFQNRVAQRQEKAQIDLENAKTPDEQHNARQRLLAMMGKTDDDHWQGVALQGGMDAQGNKTDSVLAAVNRRTGEMRRLQTQPTQQAAPPDGTKVRGKDGQVYVIKNGQPVPVGG
ncbi:hypothetical protein [Diaphorobacter ruginosibacter]|uniref:hypothetical protein n=1 Tax=Diaphorobacter ruginosibacter TaxID=1715720 RepID=UPI003340BF7E